MTERERESERNLQELVFVSHGASKLMVKG